MNRDDPSGREHVVSERQARDDAIVRAEIHAADWLVFARLAVQVLACEREEFTTDDVWRLLHEHGVPDPAEHRAMSGAVGRASRGGMIEWAPETRTTERPATHNHMRPQRVWRSLIVGRKPPEWPTPARRVRCPTCGADLSRVEVTVSPRWVHGTCLTHGRLLVRVDP